MANPERLWVAFRNPDNAVLAVNESFGMAANQGRDGLKPGETFYLRDYLAKETIPEPCERTHFNYCPSCGESLRYRHEDDA